MKDHCTATSNVAPYHLSRMCVLVAVFIAAVAVSITVILLPCPIDAVIVELHPYEDNFDNAHLRTATLLFKGEVIGPEGLAMDSKGNMYTGLADGRVIWFNDTSFETVVKMGDLPLEKCSPGSQEPLCHRPLGLEIDPSDPNLLYIAESCRGIYQYNLQTKEMKLLVNSSSISSEFLKPVFINDLVVMRNGSIFFTDTSSRFSRHNSLKEFYDGRPTGKLFHYNPKEDSINIVLSGLSFANGIHLSDKEEFLLLSETSACRITKYYLTGPKAGERELLLKGLPGIPDNISPSSSGGFWVAFMATRRDGMLDIMSQMPWIRNLIIKLRLETMLASMTPRDGMIIEYSEEGEKIRGLYDIGSYNLKYGVSEVLDAGTKLYLGSFDAPYLARMDI